MPQGQLRQTEADERADRQDGEAAGAHGADHLGRIDSTV